MTHDSDHTLGQRILPEFVNQTHAHLPVTALVGRALPDRTYQRLEGGARHTFRTGQVVKVCVPCRLADFQQAAESMSLSCKPSCDGASRFGCPQDPKFFQIRDLCPQTDDLFRDLLFTSRLGFGLERLGISRLVLAAERSNTATFAIPHLAITSVLVMPPSTRPRPSSSSSRSVCCQWMTVFSPLDLYNRILFRVCLST